MLLKLILLLTVFPLVELLLLIKIAQLINWTNTVLIVILTGVVGAAMARHQGTSVWRKIQADISQGYVPTDNIISGLLIFLGGVLLITPGLITDTIGFCTLIPYTRNFMRTWIKERFRKLIKSGQTTFFIRRF